MKKLLCGIMLSAACAGALMGYYDMSSNQNMMIASQTSSRESAIKMAAPRSRSTIETDIKNTEKKINDLDRRIAQERNTVTKLDLQKQRADRASHLRRLEDELNRAR